MHVGLVALIVEVGDGAICPKPNQKMAGALPTAIALLPLIFVGATWWAVVSFFALFAFFYLLSANLANSLGDALGYHWGESLVRKRWRRFLAQRDRG